MINWQKNYQDQVELSSKAFAIVIQQIAEINRLNHRVAELEAAQQNVERTTYSSAEFWNAVAQTKTDATKETLDRFGGG